MILISLTFALCLLLFLLWLLWLVKYSLLMFMFIQFSVSFFGFITTRWERQSVHRFLSGLFQQLEPGFSMWSARILVGSQRSLNLGSMIHELTSMFSLQKQRWSEMVLGKSSPQCAKLNNLQKKLVSGFRNLSTVKNAMISLSPCSGSSVLCRQFQQVWVWSWLALEFWCYACWFCFLEWAVSLQTRNALIVLPYPR